MVAVVGFEFRAPGEAVRLDELLGWLAGAEPSRWLDEGSVRVEGRVVRRGASEVEPGARVAVDRDLPASPLPAASGDAPWWALVPALPWSSGSLATHGGAFSFEQESVRDGVAELRLRLEGVPPAAAADALAGAGFPVLADLRHRAVLVPGGLRLATERGPSWWPVRPALPATGERGDAPVVRVSAASARVLARGHPWLLRDRGTGDTDRFRPGSLVALEGPAGEALGLARTEGPGRLAARCWSRSGRRGRDAPGPEARVAAALDRRRAWLASTSGTDALRLVHGEADALPGLAIDRLGPCLRVLRTGRACEGVLERVLAALRGHPLVAAWAATAPVVEVVRLPRSPGHVDAVRLRQGDPERLRAEPGWPEGRVAVHEAGLCFEVDPGLRDPRRPRPGVGLFLDQRANRALARERAAGGRWLNLFAHTGSFSLALLAGGARSVVSVDLSAAYLRWLARNLAANPSLDEGRHESVRSEGRRFVESLGEDDRFDGIVLDPPTAAAAGRRFWSVRRDLDPLVVRSLRQLASGGWLLVARNDRESAGRDLRPWLAGCAEAAGVGLARVSEGPPGADFPRLAGFPEGEPFRALWARRV